MRIKAQLVKGKDLKPGDLFSIQGDSYWQHLNPLGVGEKVYIRTDTPCPLNQREMELYRIIIETD